ncbi:MAG: hypothetical protein Ct9H300mP21_08140 [Pseudomonadota bacterium]|nr:MAG: hypothetical protein Ct9H300mP21_08140 [Pseudomonadota bacterium]
MQTLYGFAICIVIDQLSQILVILQFFWIQLQTAGQLICGYMKVVSKNATRPKGDISLTKNDLPVCCYKHPDSINMWMKKWGNLGISPAKGDQNSEQYYPVSITAGEDPGWHEMKYREM